MHQLNFLSGGIRARCTHKVIAVVAEIIVTRKVTRRSLDKCEFNRRLTGYIRLILRSINDIVIMFIAPALETETLCCY